MKENLLYELNSPEEKSEKKLFKILCIIISIVVFIAISIINNTIYKNTKTAEEFALQEIVECEEYNNEDFFAYSIEEMECREILEKNEKQKVFKITIIYNCECITYISVIAWRNNDYFANAAGLKSRFTENQIIDNDYVEISRIEIE